MSIVLAQLLQMVGLLVVVALAFGVVFDVVAGGNRRNIIVGAVCGAAAAVAMLLSHSSGAGFQVDARAPLLMVGALFGGPWAALVALPLPLATRISLGGPAVFIGVASVLSAIALGLCVHLASRAIGYPLSRGTVLALAGLSPLTMLSLLAPHLAPEPGMFAPMILPFLFFLPFGTAVLGLFAWAELARSDGSRTRREAERFHRSTDHVSREFFKRQLNHYAHMNVRFGTHAGYVLVSVDDAAAVRRALGEHGWRRLRIELAQVIRASVRDSDVCAAVDFDRFAVLLPHTGEAGMRVVAERIQGSVTEAFRRTPAGAVTVSIGMACLAQGHGAEDVASAAETALFVANARTPRSAIGPLLPPPASAVIHSFPAATAERHAAAEVLAPAANVAFFPVLIGPDPDSAANG